MSFDKFEVFDIDSISYFKKDIVVEAVRDRYYLSHIKKRFIESLKNSEDEAISATVKIVTNLIMNGFCSLTTGESYGGKIEAITLSDEDLRKVVEKYRLNNPNVEPFDYFLVGEEKAQEWVIQYQNLIRKL